MGTFLSEHHDQMCDRVGCDAPSVGFIAVIVAGDSPGVGRLYSACADHLSPLAHHLRQIGAVDASAEYDAAVTELRAVAEMN